MEIVSRFAPSNTSQLDPTTGKYNGLHIGGARSALYTWLFTRKNNGKFLLRIEDTDEKRSTSESFLAILEDMKWLGLSFDKEILFQSKRKTIYNRYAKRLTELGLTYEKEDEETKQIALFFRMPKESTAFNDEILGKITLPSMDCQDFPIIKSSGMATFYFANAIDDIDTGVNFVIRGNDHINSTFKQVALYKALGAPMPKYVHLTMILDQTGKKMSKRDIEHKVNIVQYRREGFLPESIINYLSILGCNFKQEDMELDQIIQEFDLKNINKNNARFDERKLLSVNSNKMQNLPIETIERHFNDWIEFTGRDWKDCNLYRFTNILDLCRKKCKTFSEIYTQMYNMMKNQVKFFKDDQYNSSALDICFKQLLLIEEWNSQNILLVLNRVATDNHIKFGDLAQTIRIAITGSSVSPPIDKTLESLGKQFALEKINYYLKIEELV